MEAQRLLSVRRSVRCFETASYIVLLSSKIRRET